MLKRILIVDEDIIGLNMLTQVLACKGYEVCPLYKVERILNAIPHCQPDLIMLNSALTRIDSDVVTRTIKAIDSVSHIPVIVVRCQDYYSALANFEQSNIGSIGNIDALVQRLEQAAA